MAANRTNPGLCDPGYEIIFWDRQGRRIKSPHKVSSLRWGRKGDEVSRSTIEYIISDDSCCEELGGLEPHAHRVEVLRSGTQVWYGWLDDVAYGREEVVVDAYDAIQWMKQRICRTDFTWTNEDQTNIFVDLWNDAMDPDPIAVELMIFLTGVLETRSVELAGMPRYAFDVAKEMLDSGLDITAIGQKVLVGLLPALKPLQFSLNDFAGAPRVVKKGSQYAGRVIVDANDTIQSIYPPGSPGPTSLYPLIEEIVRRGSLETQEAADNIALSRYEYSRRVPRLIETGEALVLSPNLDLDINDLIPGRHIIIDTEGLCYNTKQEFRIGTVDVVMSEGEEKISITTQPIGSDDLNDVEDPLS